jgi:CubicO group peptidase (beta-lactamase class C family)
MRKRSALLIGLTSALLAASAPAGGQAGDLVAPLFGPDQGETRAVLLLDGGAVRAKRYAPGYSDANRFISWSMAKTITGILVGELVADGRLRLDAPAPVAEWRRPGDPRGAITLRQLLHMSSGLEHTEVGDVLWQSDTNRAEFVDGTANMAARAIAKPLEATPGATYQYSTQTSNLLSEIITRTLTGSRDPRVRAAAYKAFAEERLFRAAGIRSAFLEFDGAGTQVGGSLIHMTLDDWGRMGMVLLTGKGVDGAEIIAPDWLAFMKTPAPTNGEYGGHVWLNRPSGRPDRPLLFPGAPPSTVSMEGHLGQHVTVTPDIGRGVVLVRLGNLSDDKFRNVNRAMGRVLVAYGRAVR